LSGDLASSPIMPGDSEHYDIRQPVEVRSRPPSGRIPVRA
jgi:hypothetical protein